MEALRLCVPVYKKNGNVYDLTCCVENVSTTGEQRTHSMDWNTVCAKLEQTTAWCVCAIFLKGAGADVAYTNGKVFFYNNIELKNWKKQRMVEHEKHILVSHFSLLVCEDRFQSTQTSVFNHQSMFTKCFVAVNIRKYTRELISMQMNSVNKMLRDVLKISNFETIRKYKFIRRKRKFDQI